MLKRIDNSVLHAQTTRRALCLPMPRNKLATIDGALVETIAKRLETALNVPSVTPLYEMIAPQQWLLCFFYGREKYTRVATYEKGVMGELKYIPQLTISLLVDKLHNQLYLSTNCDEACYEAAILQTFNGTLFPARFANQGWYAYNFDLNVLPTITEDVRSPEKSNAAWQDLKLKSLIWRESGGFVSEVKKEWMPDAFPSLDQGEFHWPKHVRAATLKFRPNDCAHYFILEMHNNTGYIRLAFTAVKLAALSALVSLMAPGELKLVEAPAMEVTK